ncbi:homoserine kinase [Aliiglaciecola sp. CAU 1673]|uniref:homoserine kinase n=1 Tax=Aliiglaciecola sp. CAU 1673 TaxID=3032595 RepID=UPI0023DAA5C3|nr:homoserine kinase [Aliiglaciecola sp. CAU 1673]MDF2179513.1 homoserine kinase [Aliiglaciecola sp. CAU 1673]
MEYEMIRAYAPASIGNVSLGFDLLGAALKPVDGSLLGDEVEVSQAESFSLSIKGTFAHKLPPGVDDNIITHSYHFFSERLKQRGKPVVPVAMVLYKNLPIGSGLGSSASSIVAALHGLNAFYGEPFSKTELLEMMGELEGQISGSVHYDNVAPSYLGGLVLMAQAGDKVALSLPVFDDWYWVVCYSGIKVSTAEARRILPKTVPLADTLTFGRQLGVFVHALHCGDRALAGAMMQDVIAEPYRKSLLTGFDEARAFTQQQGAIAFGISGSGPTVFAVTDNLDTAKRIETWLGEHYIQNSEGFSRVCRLDLGGSQALKV